MIEAAKKKNMAEEIRKRLKPSEVELFSYYLDKSDEAYKKGEYREANNLLWSAKAALMIKGYHDVSDKIYTILHDFAYM